MKKIFERAGWPKAGTLPASGFVGRRQPGEQAQQEHSENTPATEPVSHHKAVQSAVPESFHKKTGGAGRVTMPQKPSLPYNNYNNDPTQQKEVKVNEMENTAVSRTGLSERKNYMDKSSSAAEEMAAGDRTAVLPRTGAGYTTPKSARQSERDLRSGMELLEPEFLLAVVENTDAESENDITMRKLVFNELIRRHQVNTIDSSVLKIYSIDQNGFYGKDIQCQAMKELTDRTIRPGSES